MFVRNNFLRFKLGKLHNSHSTVSSYKLKNNCLPYSQRSFSDQRSTSLNEILKCTSIESFTKDDVKIFTQKLSESDRKLLLLELQHMEADEMKKEFKGKLT